ncbi:MAG: thiosulfate oxidation carrier complex protein SoxZ [Alphaproteobacteria bacterium]|nr:thiosulfate oxidation carrier complex protein SoxZ [Alphaproteobacteria bacterium]
MARVLLRVPASVEKGAVIEMRALIQHIMETGYRPNAEGVVQARDIIWKFTCRYDGEVVFNATLSPAIAANPFIAFTTVATQSGPVSFTWEGDNGFRQTETRHITVT